MEALSTKMKDDVEWGQRAHETLEMVDRIVASMPASMFARDFEPIRLTGTPEQRRRGGHSMFIAGTVAGTGKKGVLRVPVGTREVLNRLDIPYEFVME